MRYIANPTLKRTLCVAAFALSQVSASGAETVAGLTAELLSVGTLGQMEAAVAHAQEAGLSEIQIANAYGRAIGGGNGEGSPVLVVGIDLFEARAIAPAAELQASARAGQRTNALLADYRGLTNIPWGGAHGAAGGRNE